MFSIREFSPLGSIETGKTNGKRSWKGRLEGEELNHQWLIQEKIDGSQLAIWFNNNSEIEFRNGNKILDYKNNVFRKAIEALKDADLKLDSDFIYYGECLTKFRHNISTYERIPLNYFTVFDIKRISTREYLWVNDIITECKRVGLEYVPITYLNSDPQIHPSVMIKKYLSKIDDGTFKSYLGGIPEGIVLKHPHYVQDNRTISTKLKFVTDSFKERHRGGKVSIKNKGVNVDDVIKSMGLEYATDARFRKSIQHLTERGEIYLESDQMMKHDIYDRLVIELDADFDKDCKDRICRRLWLEFNSEVKKHSKHNFGGWFNAFLEKRDYVLSDNIRPSDIIIEIGLKYATSSRFSKVLKSYSSESIGKGDTHNFILLLDKNIDDEFKEVIMSDLWNGFSQQIKMHSRTGFMEWFDAWCRYQSESVPK